MKGPAGRDAGVRMLCRQRFATRSWRGLRFSMHVPTMRGMSSRHAVEQEGSARQHPDDADRLSPYFAPELADEPDPLRLPPTGGKVTDDQQGVQESMPPDRQACPSL